MRDGHPVARHLTTGALRDGASDRRASSGPLPFRIPPRAPRTRHLLTGVAHRVGFSGRVRRRPPQLTAPGRRRREPGCPSAWLRQSRLCTRPERRDRPAVRASLVARHPAVVIRHRAQICECDPVRVAHPSSNARCSPTCTADSPWRVGDASSHSSNCVRRARPAAACLRTLATEAMPGPWCSCRHRPPRGRRLATPRTYFGL